MTNLEDIYNQSLEMLKQGHSKQEVLLKFSEYRSQLAPLLDLSEGMLLMPKNIVPTPLMKRKYAMAPSKGFWLTWIHVSKFAGVSMSLMLLISAFATTGYAALKSAPGQYLFPIKKSVEKVELMMAPSQADRADLQVAIAQNRLDEAQKIFSNPTSNIEQKQAALSELASQTTDAVAVVNNVTQTNPKSNNATPLLATLTDITQKQQTFLNKITPDNQIQAATDSARKTLTQNTAQLSQINQSVAVASDNEAITKLSSDPNSVAVLGQIGKISDSQISVEKTVFNLGPQTQVKDAQGKTIDIKNLTTNTKVNVVGVKSQDKLFALQIFITDDSGSSTEPSVKAAEITNTTTADTIASESGKASTTPTFKPSKDQEQPATTTQAADPGVATGGAMFDDPRPLYNP